MWSFARLVRLSGDSFLISWTYIEHMDNRQRPVATAFHQKMDRKASAQSPFNSEDCDNKLGGTACGGKLQSQYELGLLTATALQLQQNYYHCYTATVILDKHTLEPGPEAHSDKLSIWKMFCLPPDCHYVIENQKPMLPALDVPWVCWSLSCGRLSCLLTCHGHCHSHCVMYWSKHAKITEVNNLEMQWLLLCFDSVIMSLLSEGLNGKQSATLIWYMVVNNSETGSRQGKQQLYDSVFRCGVSLSVSILLLCSLHDRIVCVMWEW